MNQEEIRIVELAPMRVAVAYAFGEQPELGALEKMERFAAQNGLLKNEQLAPTFGYNNPNPSPGSPNYGYEVLLPVGNDVHPAEEVRISELAGGLYAVHRCRGIQNIGSEWAELAKWREGTQYAAGTHQWLELLLSPLDAQPEDMILDLYLPIAE